MEAKLEKKAYGWAAAMMVIGMLVFVVFDMFFGKTPQTFITMCVLTLVAEFLSLIIVFFNSLNWRTTIVPAIMIIVFGTSMTIMSLSY